MYRGVPAPTAMHAHWGPPEYLRGQRPGDEYVRWRRPGRVPSGSALGPLVSRWLRGGLGKPHTARKSQEAARPPHRAA
jgi:hypothetical protein